MKKIIYNNIAFISILGLFLLASCDSNNQHPDSVNLGANVRLENETISNLDQNEDLELNLITNPNVSVESISIFKGANKVADASVISSSKATFSASVLAPYNEFGEDKDEDFGVFEDISIISELSNGNTIDHIYHIEVTEAISFDRATVNEVEYKNPYDDIVSEDGEKEELKKEVIYNIFTAKAIPEIKVEWKKNADGTYAIVEKESGAAFNSKADTINLKTLDYITKYNLEKGDTLYYRITATKGAISESLETKVAILPQIMSAKSSFAFSDKNKKFSFSDSEQTDLEYSKPLTLTSSSSLAFAELSLSGTELSDYYNRGDLFDARNDFEAASPLNSISSLQKDQVYLYKIVIDELEFYGMIKIGDIIVTNNDEEVVNIEFKKGNILE
ncbi:MAG: hypothetical protein ACK5H1_09340 [Tenacibaculum sp.]